MRVNVAVLGACLVGCCVLAGPALAEPNQTARAGRDAAGGEPGGVHDSVELSYSGYVAGLNALNIQAGFDMRPDGYQMGVHIQTAGLVSVFVHGDMLTRVSGQWSGVRAMPTHYVSAGIWHGDPHETLIDYHNGNPEIAALVPVDDEGRDIVPDPLRRGTTDALSAVAYLIHTVATTGGCDGTATTFDGHRLSQITAHTMGTEIVPPDSRSSFSGPALRCDIEGRLLAGFPKDAGPNDMLRRVQHSSVWLAPAQPGIPPVPVLLSVEVRLVGHMTMYLTQRQAGAQLAQFTPKLP